ncbi:MAG: hypothetical protein AAF487_05335 [Bacteroidota bacterium]
MNTKVLCLSLICKTIPRFNLKFHLAIILSFFLLRLDAQFKPIFHFVLSSEEHQTNACTFELNCECCWDDLLLFDNGHFYLLNSCENARLHFGSYSLHEEALELFYSPHVISKIPQEERDTFSSYSLPLCSIDSIARPNERYSIEACGEGQKIISLDQKYKGFLYNDPVELYEYDHVAYRPLLDLAYCKWLSERDWQKEYPNYTFADGQAFAKKGIDLLECNMDYYFEERFVFDSQSNGGYHDYKISYAPDSSFRVFTFIGEACGANCNGLYSNLVQLENGAWDKFQAAEVDHILSFNDSLYIIHSTAHWSGNMGGTSKGFKILKKEEKGFSPVQITPVITDSTSMLSQYFGSPYETYEFRLYNLWFQSDPVLTFSIKEEKAFIEYEYFHDDMGTEALRFALPHEIYQSYSKSMGSLFLKIKGSFQIDAHGIQSFQERYSLVNEEDVMKD